MDFEFTGEIWFWRGPSPWHFITVPPDECSEIEATSRLVSYGWGMIPATARIGRTEWKTSLFPKDGCYILPVRTKVREAERLTLGDIVTVGLVVEL